MMLRRTIPLLALAASSLAWGEPYEPPERIARLSYVEGQVAFHAAGEVAASALPDRPLIPRDRLVTEHGARAEITLGTAAIRLDERTDLSIEDLDAKSLRVELARGLASLRVHELLEDETLEVVTPNTAIALDEPGEYRLEVPHEGATELTVHAGRATVATAGGPVRVAAGQRVRMEGYDAHANLVTPQPADAFDEWVLERELLLADAEPSRYGLQGADGYDELDRYGEWTESSSYGRVWMPSYAYGGYDPFRHGYWERGRYGRSWVHSAPWAFFTFHHGRWAYLHHLDRWCWVPERRIHRHRPSPDTRPFGNPKSEPRHAATLDVSPARGVLNRHPKARRDLVPDERMYRGTPIRSANPTPGPPPQAAAPRPSGPSTMRPVSSTPASKAVRARSAPSADQTSRSVFARQPP